MTPEYSIRIGGLMRCCLDTLDIHMGEVTAPPKNGDTLRCKYCDDPHGMVFRQGAWEWAKPAK